MPSDRQFDVVVFGASGFTGQRVFKELSAQGRGRYAAAGRSRTKLSKVVQACSGSVAEIIIADTEDSDSLLHMAQSTKLVLSCVGPYRYYGEPVVRACVESGTDYLDVCGEPEFMELMEFRYQEKARAHGCFIVSAAGFDSIPADLGVLFTQRQFQSPAVPSAVTSFLSIQSGPDGACAHFPTWESAVGGFASAGDLRRLRKQMAMNPASLKPPKPQGPRPKRIQAGQFNSRAQGHVLPFPGSDAAVVRRTQARLGARQQPTVHYGAYFTVKSYYTFLLFAVFGKMMEVLAQYAWGRTLLLRFPGFFSFGIFSRAGPTQRQMDETKFQMDFFGDGYSQGPSSASQAPDKQVHCRVRGPEPGYIATPILLVHSALTLLEERNGCKQVCGEGGVFTAGSLFSNTSLTDRLHKAGITFQVL